MKSLIFAGAVAMSWPAGAETAPAEPPVAVSSAVDSAATACAMGEVTFHFSPDKTTLDRYSQALADRIAERTSACRVSAIDVSAYSESDEGGSTHPRPLSASRAQAVLEALIARGVLADAVTVRATTASADADGVREPLAHKAVVRLTLDGPAAPTS